MDQVSACAALAEQLQRYRLLSGEELIARIGRLPESGVARLGGGNIMIEIAVAWTDETREVVRVEATAYGPSHWRLERLRECITVPVQRSEASVRPQ